MKRLLWIFAAAAIFHYVCTDSSEESSDEDFEKYFSKEGFREVLANVCSRAGFETEILNKSQEVVSCLLQERIEDKTLCWVLRNGVKPCLQPLVDAFEDCLPAAQKSLPGLLIDSLIDFFKYTCTLNVEHLFELFNPCLFEDDATEDICFGNITDYVSEKWSSQDDSVNEEAVCYVVREVYSCEKAVLHSRCKNSITQEAFLGGWHVLVDLCNSRNATKELANEISHS